MKAVGEKSTKVVQWYAHPIEGQIRGPFMRWFRCSEVYPEYAKRVASVEDDVTFAAAAMNNFLKLIAMNEKLVEALKEVGKQWNITEMESQDEYDEGGGDIDYAYDTIISKARATLAEVEKMVET